ncbi:hypothetical protein D1007_38591 [Hordeum vulgare]|nr:hypothetical protein D1007_38591 [Hordeum vulgare]
MGLVEIPPTWSWRSTAPRAPSPPRSYTSTRWLREGRRHGARRNAAHRRCRQAGAAKFDPVELSVAHFVKPAQGATAWRPPKCCLLHHGGDMEQTTTLPIVDAVRPAPQSMIPWSSPKCRPLCQAGATEDNDMEHATTPPTVDVVKLDPRKTTTWSMPRRHPPSMSSSRSHGRRRHGARHDAAHRRCRQAGTAEDDDMEHATTPPTVDVVKPEPRKTTTWSTPRRCPPSRSSSRSRGRRRHGARHDAAHRRCRRAGAGKDNTELATTLLAFTPLHPSRSPTPLTPARARSSLSVAPRDGRAEGGVPRRQIHYMT